MAKNTITHVVELTEDEAVALVLLINSGVYPYDGFVAAQITAIASALDLADDSLSQKQFVKWEKLGSPQYELHDNG